MAHRVLRTCVVLAVIGLSGFGVVQFARQQTDGDAGPASSSATALAIQAGGDAAAPGAGPRFDRLANPGRTVVRDQAGAVLATFTDGARTVALTGPSRTLAEPRFTDATITTTTWVRLAPVVWTAGAEKAAWFGQWFEAARKDTSPDVLGVAMQYADGAEDVRDDDGLVLHGDAIFGPVEPAGYARLEQSDFLDYLGISYAFPDISKEPKPDHWGALDCSGFVRMVYGYRLGYPMLGTNDPGPGLPRRAYAIAENGPGVALIPDKGARVTTYDALQPGDLVFFEVEGGEDELDHVGIFVGIDSDGHYRFMSSRERANGPTFGDLGGTSLLDDGGMYSRGWRAARRI
ncbi:NlpC/P60 family protein [Actinophytocola algeriensis]|uniref:Cell wall-associated NlpC family hydrolase n=1 Tax=Actinophytocola algeriensis TaxID=1768010 RepID=A0A7W7QDN6_9PSEU|nr:NlpC/P60 family protein [Actinophytocola algeriensis]MBB4911619.1 cell wall-associated NlpC family hydrolase [Actinophytocola algeriensis]MBE1473393.1 cell wall-associated NlpC family hydrolase [Actinophytocola algeriensis]